VSSSINIAVGTISSVSLSLASETGSPAPGTGGTTDPPPGNYAYAFGRAVEVKSVPNTDYRFSKWSGDIVETYLFTDQATVTMDRNKSLNATFCTKCGDVNGDLRITPSDAQTAFDIFLGRLANPTWCEKENADVNSSGVKLDPKVTPADAQAIFKKYLKKGDLSGDCSGKSRASALSAEARIISSSNAHLMVSNITTIPGKDVYIPIIVESPFEITAFGFDLAFPSKILTFVGLERTDITASYGQLDANILAHFQSVIDGEDVLNYSTLRVGGYESASTGKPSSGVLLTLVFRVKGEIKETQPLIILTAYDDIQKAMIDNGTLSPKLNREITKQVQKIKKLSSSLKNS